MYTNETHLALNVILSKAASTGADIDLLRRAAAEELLAPDFPNFEKRLVNGAVSSLG